MNRFKSKYSLFWVFLLAMMVCCRVGPYVGAEGDTIFLRADKETIDPAKDKAIIITITGVKADGSPMPDALVYIETDQGRVIVAGQPTDVVMLKEGRAVATITTQSEFSGEAVTITARCGTAAAEPETLIIPIVIPDITKLFISAEPLMLSCRENTSAITVSAFDDQMNPVPGKKIWLSTSAGNLHPPSPHEVAEDGTVTATLTTSLPATVTAAYKALTAAVDIAIKENQPPVAAFVPPPPDQITVGVVYFDASQSSDPDPGDYIKQYEWVFGDGKTGTGRTVEHQYSPTVTTVYNVSLTVYDSCYAKGTIVQQLTVTVEGTAKKRRSRR